LEEEMTFTTSNLTYAAQYKGYIHPYVQEIPAGLTDVKAFAHANQNYLFIPHSINNAVVMGIPPVAPDYEWHGGKKPYSHQVATTNFILSNRESFVLSSQGTGKTLSSAWAMDIMIKETKRPVLIVAPLSTLDATWAKTFFLGFPHLKVTVLHGSKSRREKLLELPADVYVINPDGIKTIEKALCDTRKFCCINVDELTCAKNHKSGRWASLNAVMNAHREHAWLIGMTGTPIANSPVAAYGQVKLLRPVWTKNKYPYFTTFKQAVCNTVNQFIDIPKAGAEQTVINFMQPSIRFSLADCRELPDRIFETRTVQMTKEQHVAYEAMRKHLTAEYQAQQVTAVNEGVKILKLAQIAAGVAYDEEGKATLLPFGPRLEAILEVIEESERKVIIFAGLTALIDRLADELTKRKYTVSVVDGRTSVNARRDIFNNFENQKDPHILLCHPNTVSHGLTLNAASTMIWATPLYDAEIYEQALARNQRLDSKDRTVVCHIVGSPCEEVMYEKLEHKGKMQGSFLEIVAEDSKKYVQK
jgi:SNF2 family DNA or RNA helicase